MPAHAKRKAEKLGMPVSTARSRLVKLLLFRELQNTNRNLCYRCSKVIDSIDDLSIEHKESWLHNDVALFWDLDNITYSHLRCNSLAGTTAQRKRVCYNCGVLKTYDNTTRNKRRWDGMSGYCQPCRQQLRKNKYSPS